MKHNFNLLILFLEQYVSNNNTQKKLIQCQSSIKKMMVKKFGAIDLQIKRTKFILLKLDTLWTNNQLKELTYSGNIYLLV
jgi:hypothetical protein